MPIKSLFNLNSSGTEWYKKKKSMAYLCTNGSCWYDSQDPENVKKCTPGFPGYSSRGLGRKYICAPSSPRTSAEEYVRGECGYQYTGRGGLSWSIPYTAGVLALGWQIDPDMKADEAVELLFESAYKYDGNTNIIDPTAFTELVKSNSH